MNRILITSVACVFAHFLSGQSSMALPIQGSVNVRPYSVGPTGPVAHDPNIGNDFNFATAAFDQIGIAVNNLGSGTIIQDDDDSSGAWTGTEFRDSLNGQDPLGSPAGSVLVYYVANFTGAVAQTWSDEDTNPGIIIQAARNNDTLAHELGHLMLNEWRWRSVEDGGTGGIHSNVANDLMATSAGGLRNVPAALGNVYPVGSADEIRSNVGYLSTNANAKIPQITAMYYQNSQVSIADRDEFNTSVAFDGGADSNSGSIHWGVGTSVVDPNNNWIVHETARKIGGNLEEYTFFYHFSSALDMVTDELKFTINDVDSLDSNITGLEASSVQVIVYSNILTNAGQATLVHGETNDYVFTSDVDGTDYKLDNFVLTITNEAVLAGIMDVVIRFNMTVAQPIPEPSTWAMMLVTCSVGLAHSLRRKGIGRR